MPSGPDHPMHPDARLAAEIADFFRPEGARLDDRARAAIAARLGALVGAIEAELRRHAAPLLAGRDRDDAGTAPVGAQGIALPRLTAAGALRDPALMAEVIAEARLAMIAAGLPAVGGQPSLLLRLADLPDPIVAGAARALLAADSRHAAAAVAELPADVRRRLVWSTAAAIRVGDDGAVDRALAEAARRCLAAHDEGEPPAALAARLAAAIDPLPAELPALLIEALGDRRPMLFVAVLARALDIEGDVARTLVLDPEGALLWPALRAIGLGRADIARIALALADADPRRDIEAFADRLDAIAALDPDAARGQIASLTLPREFRAAIARLEAR